MIVQYNARISIPVEPKKKRLKRKIFIMFFLDTEKFF